MVAALGLLTPGVFAGISTEYFTALLGMLMLSMGITLTVDDFKRVLAKPAIMVLGFLGCYGLMPALALGQIPQIHEASSLDSARRRANAAAKAAGGEAEQYADPETERYGLEDIQKGSTPRQLNPVCKELYLRDAEFVVTFGMDKDAFWKLPFWKQRDAKRKMKLF